MAVATRPLPLCKTAGTISFSVEEVQGRVMSQDARRARHATSPLGLYRTLDFPSAVETRVAKKKAKKKARNAARRKKKQRHWDADNDADDASTASDRTQVTPQSNQQAEKHQQAQKPQPANTRKKQSETHAHAADTPLLHEALLTVQWDMLRNPSGQSQQSTEEWQQPLSKKIKRKRESGHVQPTVEQNQQTSKSGVPVAHTPVPDDWTNDANGLELKESEKHPVEVPKSPSPVPLATQQPVHVALPRVSRTSFTDATARLHLKATLRLMIQSRQPFLFHRLL
ncbi:hypothetical protein BU23DRAFT_182363 [Bimuria novae-zelandiae CBS 107.79]|uniref:Uncharacterized protein n=1 Tax=Bimuria novae-zelandiae CBS 107.79 TaxID=1447943 RepID=A0A6A5VDX1_9PLEO|nr:hypothetical protein BU23DRAFT_182363 [Bimuria novae-zelandiae CBS 107.79]